MIGNIRDHRKSPYRWKKVDAVIEALEHDNANPDADQAAPGDPKKYVLCEDLCSVSVSEAIDWATNIPYHVTLFLYDFGASGMADEDDQSGG